MLEAVVASAEPELGTEWGILRASVGPLESRIRSLEGQGLRADRRAAQLASLAQALTEEQRALLVRLDRIEGRNSSRPAGRGGGTATLAAEQVVAATKQAADAQQLEAERQMAQLGQQLRRQADMIAELRVEMPLLSCRAEESHKLLDDVQVQVAQLQQQQQQQQRQQHRQQQVMTILTKPPHIVQDYSPVVAPAPPACVGVELCPQRLLIRPALVAVLLLSVAAAVVVLPQFARKGALAYSVSQDLTIAKWGGGCQATTEEQCLSQAGCRWFWHDDGPCDLCGTWFGDQSSVTGCRDWEPSTYCQETIFLAAQRVSGGDPAANAAFRAAVQHYRIRQGSGDPGDPLRKESLCNVWCDAAPPRPCFGQPRAADEVKGTNYGGRFLPEFFLGIPGSLALFQDVTHPPGTAHASLCDVGNLPDATARMTAFLDLNVRAEHFQQMAARGINVVRVPLGYWNLVDLPAGATPNGAGAIGARWRSLQNIMPAASYTKWIDQVFAFASQNAIRVLMDLHGAPGAQADKSFTGCNPGFGNMFFDTDWNRQLSVQAVEAMAVLCQSKGANCYGLELLNEPDGRIPRDHLLTYYTAAITAVRKHLPLDKPLMIMEWPDQLGWWKDRKPFNYASHGRILFSTHVYPAEGADTIDQQAARDAVAPNLAGIKNFHLGSPYPLVVTEYALAGHGSAMPEDLFDYNSLASWYVHQFNQFGAGSMVWNFDAKKDMPSWGPIAAPQVGSRPVDWEAIYSALGN